MRIYLVLTGIYIFLYYLEISQAIIYAIKIVTQHIIIM